MGRKVDLIGERFGRLVVVEEDEPYISPAGYKKVKWMCRCACGSMTSVAGGSLSTGKTKSCGCLNKEASRARATKHGLAQHPLYRVWNGIKDRCLNPKTKCYKHYGGRGIFICQEWRDDFKVFYDWSIKNGYKEGLEIDRADTNKGYSPDNCRFVTHSQNMMNTRSRGGNSKYKGMYKYRRKWAAKLGINGKKIHIGYFNSETEAAKAYNKAAIKYFGEYANLNVIKDEGE